MNSFYYKNSFRPEKNVLNSIMGCSGSTEKGISPHAKTFRRQKISFQVGENVRVKGPPTVVFVFGGPGSKKGKLVTDLTQTYGFKLINVERIVVEKLCAKKSSSVSDVDISCDIQDIIKEEKEKLNLYWLLNQIAQKIDENHDKCYLIDIMPNLRLLVQSEELIKTCAKEMETFERKFPISFALHFALPLDKITREHDAKVRKIGEANSGVKSDEADSTRTKKRAALFEQSVKPFLDFFKEHGRLMTVDVSSGHYESIWAKVCEAFADLELQYFSNVNNVIIFSFDGTEKTIIDLPTYQLNVIVMQDHVQPTDSQEETLNTLYKLVNQMGPTSTNFIVDLRNTCLAQSAAETEKAVVFMDDDTVQLDKYVAMHTKGSPCTMQFRVVSSPENRICLFPKDSDITVCKKIALFTAS